MATTRVFFDIAFDGAPAGRVVMEVTWTPGFIMRNSLVLCIKNACCLFAASPWCGPKDCRWVPLNADKSWISTRTWTLRWNPCFLGVSGVDLCPFEASLRPHEPYIEIQRWEAVGEAGSASLKNQCQGQVRLCATTWTPSSRTEEWGTSAPPSPALFYCDRLWLGLVAV